ncbi:putative protein-s isoprenylcysteine O-methyltransferase [Planoprotostelium fungivorum]|uniref:Protein-S-isoprenylcysteine O-methyltransferase n=1 Tax=Planoprotostelium fungivorum TaxID=1890364 RepID=A0A2P6NLA2_9EUKA|nr:putative protein-s isoprenylcysteine O-methyltransferase [Planoprotostelium fungivorum]
MDLLTDFLLHNPAYLFAFAISIVESIILRLFSVQTGFTWTFIFLIGFIGICVGQFVRTTALVTAGRNFDHQIQKRHKEGHKLVEEGIYSWVRHPGYCGWFMWAVSTQVMMCNIVSVLLYVAVIWTFFAVRIQYEEETLVRFFGQNYEDYRRRVVHSGVPFSSIVDLRASLPPKVVVVMTDQGKQIR